MLKKGISIVLSLGIIFSVYYYLHQNETLINESFTENLDSLAAPVIEVEPTVLYGMVVDSFSVAENSVQRNQSISDILLAYNVSHQDIFKLANISKSVFDVRRLSTNKKYTVIYEGEDSLPSAKALVYEPNPEEYVVFNLRDSMHVYIEKRPIEIRETSLSGRITSSLYNAIREEGGSDQLVNLVADMYGWQIDFGRLYAGDKFKILYTEKAIEGEAVGIQEIIGAEFVHSNSPFLSVAFDQGNGIDYFDEKGKSLRKAFLRYPVEYSRISSRYTKKRFHPVQKRYKAHLGTDFAARTGTPIYAASDGIITKAAYEKYNGNNVKIRHNSTFETQYLHMSKIASGIKNGTRVKQGQVIGYVGSTGLATGPHLCYRFWKNGVQVDGLNVELPPSEPIVEDHLSKYMRYKDYVKHRLDQIEYPEETKEVLLAGVQ